MLSKKWSHQNSKVSSHQANQMFVRALTRIHIRVHTLHTFSVFPKLEVSKWSRFSNQSNGTHIHLSSHIYMSYVKEYKGTEKHSSYALVWLRLPRWDYLELTGGRSDAVPHFFATHYSYVGMSSNPRYNRTEWMRIQAMTVMNFYFLFYVKLINYVVK